MRLLCGQAKAEAILDGVIQDLWPKRRPGLGTGAMVIDVDASRIERRQKAQSRVDWGFWRRFLEDEMQIKFDDRRRMRFYRALKFVAHRRAEGSTSLSALRGEPANGSSRSRGGAVNARKACALMLMGNAGAARFLRWRRTRGIHMKIPWMKRGGMRNHVRHAQQHQFSGRRK